MLQTFRRSPYAAPAFAQGIGAAAGARPRRCLTGAERAARIEDLRQKLEWAERRIRCLASPMTVRRLFGLADLVEDLGRRAATVEMRRWAVRDFGGSTTTPSRAAVELGMLRRALARAGG